MAKKIRKIHKIMVPTDFSENSLPALSVGVDLARQFGAEVLVTHILQSPLYPFGFGAGSEPMIEKELLAAANQHLDRIVSEYGDEEVEMRGLLERGHTFEAILHLAKEEEIDLIVISTHGHTGIKHVMLGSIAEKVVRMAPCPVLVVPPA